MKLSELKAVEAAATPGPWRKTADILRGGGCISTWSEDLFHSYANPPTIQTSRDCDFIAAARSAMPKLIAVAEAARHARETLLQRLPHGANAHRRWLHDELDFVFAPLYRALAALEADD